MAGLDHLDDANSDPFVITAVLEQGIVLDSFYGLALDGILVSQMRKAKAVDLGLRRDGGQELDGGLHVDEPIDWPIPIARCVPDGFEDDWHWMCSVGFPIDTEGRVISDRIPDTHRLSVRLDARRANQVSVKVPSSAGGSSGRFRSRITPVLSLPAYAVRWRAVGNMDETRELISSVSAIGARRGSGEGAVTHWAIERATEIDNPWEFAHKDLNDSGPSRPMPITCASVVVKGATRQGIAGVRPPLLHRSRQRLLALPGD